jgi:serine/threonine-protein kinase
MGVVYHAFDPTLMRHVAIKIIRAEALADPESRKRFDHEAMAAGMLKHPGIVMIYDRGEDKGHSFLVMELVEGRTMDLLLKERKLPVPAVLRILQQVAEALDYAHSRKVIHRDIKPPNIMVQQDGTAKIMDFGIAKSQLTNQGALTVAGMLAGSPFYMPPERFLDGSVTGASDLWSLGATAYEALIGRRPFQAENWGTLFHQICHQPPPEPSQVKPDMPLAAGAALLRALAKSPDQRYSSCSAFVAELAAAYEPAAAPTERLNVPAQLGPLYRPEPHSVTEASAAPVPDKQQAPAKPELQPSKPRDSRRALLLSSIGIVALAAGALVYYVVSTANSRGESNSSARGEGKAASLLPVLKTPSGEMVLIGKGPAKIGKAAQTVELDDFYVDKTEVSAGVYREFCQATGRPLPEGLDSSPPDSPVVNVTFEDAQAFAAWAGKRLPSAIEWEKAARGPSGLLFPWGNDFREGAANVPANAEAARSAKLASVTSLQDGASPYGVLNMVGNVWEWTGERAPPPAGVNLESYRKMFHELTPPLLPTEPFYQVRGGSFRFAANREEAASLCWDYNPMPARARLHDIGFRCVRSVETNATLQ